MGKEIKCPLCDNNNVEFLEKINTNDIVNLWTKQNVDISKLFYGIESLNKLSCINCGLEFFDPFVSGDNAFYSLLGEEEWYYMHEDKTEFFYSNQYIKNGDCVLDIGSGRGAFLKYIDKKISYTGLELSSKAVEYAKNENINVIEKTIEEFSMYNKYNQDIVVSFQVLEHITDLESFIKSALLTLKLNGLLIIAVPNNMSFIRNVQNNLLNLPPHHLLHWNEKSLKYIAKKFNLEIVDVYKEQVTNIHKVWFYSTIISKIIRDILRINTKSLNNTMMNKIIQKISSILSRIFKYSSFHLKKDGHTIAIVFRKV